jgi:DNA-binding transcriptional ArsR family regulator
MNNEIGALCAALADDTRRNVLDAVARSGPTTATRISADLPVSRQAVAKHLSVLESAGLVTQQRAGRETTFDVVPGSLRPLASWVQSTESAWNRRLERLRRHVERH